MFSKKAREPYNAFKKFAVVSVSQSRIVKQALKAVLKSSTLVKAIFTINVSKIERAGKSGQVYCLYCTRATLISKPIPN